LSLRRKSKEDHHPSPGDSQKDDTLGKLFMRPVSIAPGGLVEPKNLRFNILPYLYISGNELVGI